MTEANLSRARFQPDSYVVKRIMDVPPGTLVRVFERGQSGRTFDAKVLGPVPTGQDRNPQVVAEVEEGVNTFMRRGKKVNVGGGTSAAAYGSGPVYEVPARPVREARSHPSESLIRSYMEVHGLTREEALQWISRRGLSLRHPHSLHRYIFLHHSALRR